jgi:hypothetical protein
MAAVASPVSAQQAPLRPWGEFSVRPALGGSSARVEIGIKRVDPQGAPEYQFRGEIVERRGAPARMVSADTHSCPGSLDQLRALQKLSMPQPDVPGIDEGVEINEIVMDGARYVLKMDGAWPDRTNFNGTTLAIASNVGTPLAQWVNSMLVTLKPCWKDAVPN